MPRLCCPFFPLFLSLSLTGEGHTHEKVTIALGLVSGTRPAVTPASGAQIDHIPEESVPISNGHGAIPLAECKNMVFMGTLACGGHAKAVVTATGDRL